VFSSRRSSEKGFNVCTKERLNLRIENFPQIRKAETETGVTLEIPQIFRRKRIQNSFDSSELMEVLMQRKNVSAPSRAFDERQGRANLAYAPVSIVAVTKSFDVWACQERQEDSTIPDPIVQLLVQSPEANFPFVKEEVVTQIFQSLLQEFRNLF